VSLILEPKIEKHVVPQCADKARDNFCLSIYLPHDDMYAEAFIYIPGERCDHPRVCDTIVFDRKDGRIVGETCSFVLQPSKAYILESLRSSERSLIKLVKFWVADPDHTVVLEEYACQDISCTVAYYEAKRRMCYVWEGVSESGQADG